MNSQRLVLSGNVLEHMVFPYDFSRMGKSPYSFSDAVPEVKSERSGVLSGSSSRRAAKALRRLVDANIGQYKKPSGNPFQAVFVTFTFRADVRDMATANGMFSLGLQRLNYFLFGSKQNFLKYVAVPEFQDLNRGGVLHYHVLFFNLPYIYRAYDRMKEVWQYGHVNIQSVARIKSVSSYISKYLTKASTDNRLFGFKKYFASKGLFKPLLVRASEAIDLIVSSIKELPKFKDSFAIFSDSDMKMDYSMYELSRSSPAIALVGLFCVAQ